MKKFIFRLEMLMKVRKVRERTLKRELEHAHQKYNQIQEEEKTLHQQIDTLMDEMQAMRVEGRFDLQETYSQILDQLSISLNVVQNHLAAQQIIVEEQQKRLKVAVQERKVIEKIKEKHYSGWRTSEIQTEGALLDEINCNKQAQFK